ncbi:hypothetical protein AK812_SmicGene25945 [Symbiodinium microadriaticum]|uniref:Uncharacterized protein n=1 Tax=Symbiodinium microadriaticum TaxID=2951 RepID=A0A1Q9DAK3_SYMMI|nr:hypothetical protein AK812_SmicGene25945 [Symbiodinium microadriaticum]
MRRLNFFDRHVVKEEGSDVHPGIQRLNVTTTCGSSDHLWLGEAKGEVRCLDRQSRLSGAVRVFDRELIALSAVSVAIKATRLPKQPVCFFAG